MSLGKQLYESIKAGVIYVPEIHCPAIIDMYANNEGESDFCLKYGISRQRFVSWQMLCPIFREAVALAKEVGYVSWMRMYTEWEPDPDVEKDKFDFRRWAELYKKNFGTRAKVSIYVDPNTTPIQQYEAIMHQASTGHFTSGEIKQIMESINIGLRAHEVCNIQKEVDELKEGLKKMEERELEHSIAANYPPQENKTSLAS